MKASDIIDQAARRLSDKGNDEWKRADLAHALAFVLREMVRLQPLAFSRPDTIKLAAGYEQSVPSDVVRWLGAVRNMGSDGSTPGRAIRNANKEAAEAVLPSIEGSKPGSVVRDVYWSEHNPRTFFVYPPVTSSQDVHIQYRAAKEPTTGSEFEADESIVVTPTDDYASVIVDGVIAHALSKQSGFHSERRPDEAAAYWQKFYNVLGAAEQGDAQ